MGSSGERKPNDTLRINKPVVVSSQGDGSIVSGGVGGDTTNPPDINNICPIRFRVKLTRSDVPAGLDLVVDDNILTAPGVGEVGKLSSRTIKRLEICSGVGIAYTNILSVIDQGVCYAEFSQ